MNPHLITVYLLIEANEHLQGQVAEALQGVLTDEMRTSAGRRFGLDRLGDRRRRHRVIDRAGPAPRRLCARQDSVSPLAMEGILMSITPQHRALLARMEKTLLETSRHLGLDRTADPSTRRTHDDHVSHPAPAVRRWHLEMDTRGRTGIPRKYRGARPHAARRDRRVDSQAHAARERDCDVPATPRDRACARRPGGNSLHHDD